MVWAGRPQHSEDARRSLPLALLGSVMDAIPDAQWISLQVGNRAGDALALRGWLHDMSPVLQDFVDTASVIANLNHVVAVDTGVAHPWPYRRQQRRSPLTSQLDKLGSPLQKDERDDETKEAIFIDLQGE